MPSRQEVYTVIDGERSYQENGAGNARTDRQSTTTGESLVMLLGYIQKAVQDWNGPHPEGRVASQHNVRKIAAIAVREMELNGAFPR